MLLILNGPRDSKLLAINRPRDDGTRIRRDFKLRNFRDAVKLVNNVAALAEREQHHPDLHLEGYRNLWIEIFTHAIGGLSENDFILAAKIDAIAPA